MTKGWLPEERPEEQWRSGAVVQWCSGAVAHQERNVRTKDQGDAHTHNTPSSTSPTHNNNNTTHTQQQQHPHTTTTPNDSKHTCGGTTVFARTTDAGNGRYTPRSTIPSIRVATTGTRTSGQTFFACFTFVQQWVRRVVQRVSGRGSNVLVKTSVAPGASTGVGSTAPARAHAGIGRVPPFLAQRTGRARLAFIRVDTSSDALDFEFTGRTQIAIARLVTTATHTFGTWKRAGKRDAEGKRQENKKRPKKNINFLSNNKFLHRLFSVSLPSVFTYLPNKANKARNWNCRSGCIGPMHRWHRRRGRQWPTGGDESSQRCQCESMSVNVSQCQSMSVNVKVCQKQSQSKPTVPIAQ